jgi:hypothetical protein
MGTLVARVFAQQRQRDLLKLFVHTRLPWLYNLRTDP